MDNQDPLYRFEDICSEIPIDEDEAREILADVGIDAEAAYERLLRRLATERLIQTQEEDAMILTCNCDHEYQDELYGHKKRVHNPCARSAGVEYARCTVCGTKKPMPYSKVKDTDDKNK